METSRSEGGDSATPELPAVEIVAGGRASALEVAAIAAAVEELAEEPEGAVPARRWRWSGRQWATSSSRGWAGHPDPLVSDDSSRIGAGG